PNGEMRWPNTAIGKLKRDILFVPAAMPGLDLLLKMQSSRIHLALVIDEYGGTDGLVSIEDLVEEIVGDIDDEYDDDTNKIEVIKEDEFIVDGDTKISMVNEMIGLKIESEDFDTIG